MHLMSGVGQYLRARWRHADTVFVVLDLFGDADNHYGLLLGQNADKVGCALRTGF